MNIHLCVECLSSICLIVFKVNIWACSFVFSIGVYFINEQWPCNESNVMFNQMRKSFRNVILRKQNDLSNDINNPVEWNNMVFIILMCKKNNVCKFFYHLCLYVFVMNEIPYFIGWTNIMREKKNVLWKKFSGFLFFGFFSLFLITKCKATVQSFSNTNFR